MHISDEHRKIIMAEICPYCGSSTKRTDQMEIYGRVFSSNEVIVCSNYPKCDSYVGCHSTGEPLGRLADKKLRSAKKEAHFYFDQLWKKYKTNRGFLYQCLSDYLEIPPEFTHIGMFKVETCKKVTNWSKERIKEINQE